MNKAKKILSEHGVAEVKMTYKTKIPPSERQRVTSAENAVSILRPFFEDTIEYSESCRVMLLNRNNQVLGIITIATGGLTACVVDVRVVFQSALLANATGIILCHNHPSGNLNPSQADNDITNKIVEAGKIIDIHVLDHIILTPESYFSYADNGKL